MLLHRVVREAVRNVVAHARAEHLTAEVATAGLVDVSVTDDGIGMQKEAEAATSGCGCWRTRCARPAARSTSGRLVPPASGVTATIPLLEH